MVRSCHYRLPANTRPAPAERDVRNFLIAYQQASPEEKEKLKAIWSEAGLGPFPETA